MGVSDYAKTGDSVSLAKLGDQPFTIVKVEDSNYTQGEESTEGVKITTEKSYTIQEVPEPMNKFHTTRIAIVQFLKRKDVREDINSGKKPLGPVKCVEQKSASGKDFFNIVDCDNTGKIIEVKK